MLHTLFENMWGSHFILRWLHLFFGIMWIGILYYFNFIHGSFMGEATTDAATKSRIVQTHLPRAMWWFRWGAMWTFITGLTMIMMRMHVDVQASGPGILFTPFWLNILTGATFGTLMFLNVWVIIHPAQKVVIANAVNVAGGKPANPDVPKFAAKAGLASRTNTLFSIPMMFFMLAANHLGYQVRPDANPWVYWIVALIVIFGLELNGIKGKTGPMTSVKGVITCGFILTAVFMVLLTVLV